jgi:hypothetical protein
MALAGEAALGYICTTFHATGTDFPLIQEILKHVYAGARGLVLQRSFCRIW